MSLLPAASSCCDPCGEGTSTTFNIADLIEDALAGNLGIFNVTVYGADNTGVADATEAIQEAIDAAADADGTVYFPPGTYRITEQLLIPTGSTTNFLGLGSNAVTINATTLTDTAFYTTGSLTALPALNSAIIKGQTTVTFTAAHGLALRDLFILENTDDYSFNAVRDIYHAGEWFEVAEVLSATQVRVTRPAYAAYTPGANISLFKVTPSSIHMHGLSITYATGLGAGFSIIQVSIARNCIFSDLDLRGSQYTQLFVDRCYNTLVKDCRFFDNQATIGNNYGVTFTNSQLVKLDNCEGMTTRHVVTFGGGVADGAVPNSAITIIGGNYSTRTNVTGNSWAVDFHGNCRDYELIGVNAPGGLGLGGDGATITGGRYGNSNLNTTSIVGAEMCGLNVHLDGCIIYATQSFDNGLVSIFARTTCDRPSTLNLKNVRVEMGAFTSSTYPAGTTSAIQFGVIDVPATDELAANFINITSDHQQSTAGPFYLVQYFSDLTLGVAAAFKRLNFTGCVSDGAGILLDGDAEEVFIDGMTLPNALAYGIRVIDKGATVKYSPQRWSIKDTNTSTAQRDGILFEGSNVYTKVTFEDCTSTNCGQQTAATFYSIRVVDSLTVDLKNNTVGDDQAAATQANITSISAVTIRDLLRNNAGQLANPSLVPIYAGYTTLITDPPYNGPIWNYTANGFEWGGTGASATIPYLFRSDSNNFIQWSFQNRIAAGNTSAGMGLQVAGGTTAGSNSASGIFAAWAQDYTLAYRAGKAGPEVNSDADALLLAAPNASQRIDCYAASTTLTFQLDGSATASHTRMLVYDVDSGLLQRVKAGANGTGPGGTGRALYIDNV